ncbi:guanine nucleotide-binding protein G(o) subunit alpha [Biomphalaria glabrata]|uniref:Guanine nucleotide-binding protein G(O) subunit alpha-like n=1 Tax=Biomphalaria glabrata TaxID=6526 RepID=A0A9W2ZT16_BIOGL|nr:guanine nucleotide-binding protein G(o) subunit alpha-like [Biomphalaria glabrata]XP_055878023.1 guanine nucleotide-binding protein G(o) subunit alpha-like [Biomphalaria glabrata]
MGLCFSLDQEEEKARARSEAIDQKLRKWAKEEENIMNILLLGAAEGGKSTLVKQMKIIHHDGFSHEELMSFRPAVLENLVNSMQFVLGGMGLLRINLEKSNNKAYVHTILSCRCCYDEENQMYANIYEALRNLWRDRGVRAAVARGYEYELNDSAIYYFENMERICSLKYIPSSTDVLRARVRTTGVIETWFKVGDIMIRMYDVGGQRSERRKWTQCFDNVRCVLFVVAISAYDMCLIDEPSLNRLEESLKMFSQISNNRFFIKSTMILFLNKLDLFQDKIKYSKRHLRYFFPDFTGPDKDVDSAARYIQHLFLMQVTNPSKVVYPHFTTATDTTNVQVVFQVLMDSILRDNLKSASLL